MATGKKTGKKKRPAAARKAATKKAPAKKAPAKKAPAKKAPTQARKTHAPPPRAPEEFEAGAPELAEENPLAEVKEVFDHYDRNDNGFIESGELSRLLEALNAPPTQLELSAAVTALDSNSSGKISWDEFKEWWLRR